METKDIKHCLFRQCNCPITWKTRSDIKYCSDSCRKMEHTYLKRDRDELKEKQKTYENLIGEHIVACECSTDTDEMLKLYSLAYNQR